MRRIGTLLIAAAAALVVSCKDSTSPDGGGGSAFEITVSAGTKPTYSWSAAGSFQSLSVVRAAAATDFVWGIADSPLSNDPVTSPITHGTVPATALPTFNEEPTLTAGVEYRVSITFYDGKTAWKEFTP